MFLILILKNPISCNFKAGNKMDVDILAIDERIAMITGLLSLSEIDSNMNDDYQWGAKI